MKTNTTLVELTTSLRQFFQELDTLARGYPLGDRSYPPEDDIFWESAEMADRLQEMVAILNRKAPEGYYFGPHPNLGGCYGYWLHPGHEL